MAFDATAQDNADASIATWQRGPGLGETAALMGGRYLNLYRRAQGLAALPLVGVLGEVPLHTSLTDPAGAVLPVALSAEALLSALRAGSLDGVVVDVGALPPTLIGPLEALFRQNGGGHVAWVGTHDTAALRPLLTEADAVVIASADLRDGMSGVYRDLRVAGEGPDVALWRGLFTARLAEEAPVLPARDIA